VHIISRKALIRFWIEHPDSKIPLSGWYKIVDKTDFHSFAKLRKALPSVARVDDLFIFDIAGNKYRLITSSHFNRSKVYIRHILSHTEYDREDWKK